MNMLIASLLWGSVGVGYLLYGRNSGSALFMAGGGALIIVSYVTSSAWVMSLLALALLGLIHLLRARGWHF